MPRGARSTRSSWLFRDKPAVAVASGSDAYGQFAFSIYYDVLKFEASCTLHQGFPIEGFDNDQFLSLVLRPENIAACEWCPEIRDCKIAPEMLALVPTLSDPKVSRLNFRLHSTAAVICPATRLPLRFTHPNAPDFTAFSKLCQTTNIDVYIKSAQLSKEQQQQLERFAFHMSPRPFRTNAVDLRRFRGGRGAQEARWEDINLQEMEPYAEPGASQGNICTLTGKRQRNVSGSTQLSDEPFAKMTKLHFDNVPSGSPTEPNTPSVGQVTPCYKYASSSASLRAGTSHGNASCSPSASPTANIRPGSPLPAYSVEPDTRSLPKPTPRASVSPWGYGVEIEPTLFSRGHKQGHVVYSGLSRELISRLHGIVEDLLPGIVAKSPSTTLGPLMDSRLEVFATDRIDTLVREQVLQSNYDALQQNMEKFIDDAYCGHQQAESDIRESVEDGKTEIHQARDEGLDEIAACAREHLDDFEEGIKDRMDDAYNSLVERTALLEKDWIRKFEHRETLQKGNLGTSRRVSV